MMLRADSLEVTHAVAASLAALARPGDIIVLAGEMGAGKTAFAQGFGRALGITEAITSPTFTLVHSHPCPNRRLTLHHADLYRLDHTVDVEELALHELAEFEGIVLIEWGDVAAAGLGDHLEVRLRRVDETVDGDVDGDVDRDVDGGAARETDPADEFGLDDRRMIELYANGSTWAGRWERLTASMEPYRC